MQVQTNTLPEQALKFYKYLDWDSRSGKLWWKPREAWMFKVKGDYPSEPLAISFNKRWAGKEAFTAIGNHGYKTGALESKNYLAHRII